MNIVICDDDAQAREYYTLLVETIARKNGLDIRLTTYENGKQFLFELEDMTEPPDIVFLDVLMPKVGGMEVARVLSDQHFAGVVIFLSISREYALNAFDVRAFNYVLKTDDGNAARFRRVFLEAVAAVDGRKRRFILINGISDQHNIPIDAISHFEVSGRVCIAHYDLTPEKTGEGARSFEFISSLGKLENLLLPYGFIRTHRAFLVNCSYVESYTYLDILLSDGVEVLLGRAKRTAFREAMEARATVRVTSDDDE